MKQILRKRKRSKRSHVHVDYVSTYSAEIWNSFNLELQVKDTEPAIRNKLKNIYWLNWKSLNLWENWFQSLKKIESDDGTKYSTFYLLLKAETIINERNTDDVFESIYSTSVLNISKLLEKCLGWINDSVADHAINASKYTSLGGSRSINLSKELDHKK